MCFDYKDVIPINAKLSTVWLVKFENGCRQLQCWHKDTKIEHVVKAVKTQWPKIKFTVSVINVGVFVIHHIEHSLSDGRTLNQNMKVVI